MNCIMNRLCEDCEYGHCKSLNWEDNEGMENIHNNTYKEWKCNIPEDLIEAVDSLLHAFPNSFINERGEFIAHERTNQYIILNDCETPQEIECKVLEWFSRPAYKTEPYSQEWRNKKFHEFMRNGINTFLDTSFSEEEMCTIYTKLGNRINHQKTIKFIESDYDFNILN